MEKVLAEPEVELSIIVVLLMDGQSKAKIPDVGKAEVVVDGEEDVVDVVDVGVSVIERIDSEVTIESVCA